MAAPLRLVSRLALVTGGGSGIGHAVCQKLAREGAAVAVVDVIEAAAHETMRTLPCDHPEQQHEAFCADISSSEGVKQLLEGVQGGERSPEAVGREEKRAPRLRAGRRSESQSHREVLHFTTGGTFLITRGFSNALIASGAKKGSIINLGSIVGKVGNLGQANYAASKAGVEGLTKTAAKELARFGIRCNTVAPGFIATPMTDKVPKKVLEKIEKVIPLGRLGDPEDVAEACAFLASDDSSYITGTSLEITGGLFL
uniref:(3R)-3-hydroxyacyl-CoA dehydrogenase n=1 Tax=Latimeria chalumnae TaxID=7897 RepID=H3AXS7_LATCH